MVDTINELTELSRKLNQKSDILNETIATINGKLAKLNLGVEAWLESNPVDVSDPFYDYEKDEQGHFPLRNEVILGYCKFKDAGWVLVAKETEAQKDDEGYFETKRVVSLYPLIQANRLLRAKAMRLIPALLDQVKTEAQSVLASIEEAKNAADKL